MLIGLLVVSGYKFSQRLVFNASTNFNVAPLYYFNALYPILIGIFLGVPLWVKNLSKKGKWLFDWTLFLPIGLPTLLLNLISFASFTPLSKYLTLIYNKGQTLLFMIDKQVLTISGIICGYILVSSIKKREEVTDPLILSGRNNSKSGDNYET